MRVVIIGSGFAGLEAAILLSKKRGIRLTVIDRSKYFTFAPSIHFFISKKRKIGDITIDLKKFYNSRNVEFINKEVTYVNPRESLIKIKNRGIRYDCLVVACGFKTNFFSKNIRENSLGLKTVKDAIKIRDELDNFRDGKTVIGGGGLTGVETAYELKELGVQTALIEKRDSLMGEFDKKIGVAAERHMKKAGIEVIKGIGIKEIKDKKVILEDRKVIDAGLVIWTAGIVIPDFIINSGIPADRSGITVNEFLQSLEYKNIYAIGDIANVKNVGNKKTAQTAVIMGKAAAKNILRGIKNRPLLRFRAKQALYLISLGKTGMVVYKNFFMINKIFLWLKNFVELVYMMKRRFSLF